MNHRFLDPPPMLLVPQAPAAVAPSTDQQAPEVRLCDRSTSVPFVMVREFPFLVGRVNGVRGKLMLDTGSGPSLTLNDHLVPLGPGTRIGTGFFGSGQKFDRILRPTVDRVEVAGRSFRRVTMVTSQDARQLEAITPDFIGWIGYDAWRGCAMKLDYRRRRVTFYAAGKDFLRGEHVIAALPFRTPRLPNHPITHASIGGRDFEVAFDTGQYGGLYTDADTKAALMRTGALRPARDDVEKVDVTFQIDGGPQVEVDALEDSPAGFPPAKSMGLDGRNVLSLGFGLLKRVKTVWDFTNHRLFLLRR